MDFEPFHSDDEDVASFMPEKKKKDGGEKRKKSKGTLFKSDKKDKNTFNDLQSPTGLKTKHSVHGVVGPADYIFDQGSPPNGETSAPVTQPPTQQPVQQQMQPVFNNDFPVNSTQPVVQSHQTNMQQPAAFPQPAANFPSQTFSSSQPLPQFQPHFPPVTTMSSKIERPHSSAALLQERQLPQSPTPFKQHVTPQSNTPQKMTLLAQAMSSHQFLPGSLVSLVQSDSYLTHHRNQSYSRAMSVPILSKPELHEVPFQAHFESSLDINTGSTHEFAQSPIPEVVTPTNQGSLSSPPASPVTRQPTSEEFWSNTPSKQTNTTQGPVDNDWAYFAASTSPHDIDGHLDTDLGRRKSHGAESLADSIADSVSSVDSELDDSVWKINYEQREYYTDQFKNIQPNDGEVIKGPQARDFFMKSNLPKETLSKIWHLSDLDKDFGLNLDEFCIAMHLVVAVRHGVDLPHVLPLTLIPKEEADPFDVSLPSAKDDIFQRPELTEEKRESPKWAADFDGVRERSNSTEVASEQNEVIQTTGQSSPTATTIPVESRVQPVSSQQEEIDGNVPYMNKPLSASTEFIQQTTDANFSHLTTSPKLRHHSTPSSKESGSNNTAIARPRASGTKNVNLMDASPWQLLPPPSSKMKQPVKRSLTLDGELGSTSSDTSNCSIERTDTLVTIDRGVDEMLGVRPLPVDESDDTNDEIDRLKIKIKEKRTLSKEKSRSIDSLRSDISESSEFQWRRQSLRRDSRPRSLTGDSFSSYAELAMHEKVKEFEIPPTPPPRNKGHARASSLDLNQLFSSKSSHSAPALNVQSIPMTTDAQVRMVPPKPPRASIQAKSPDKALIRPRPTASADVSSHRRSFSLDSEVVLGPPRKPAEAFTTNLSKNEETKGIPQKVLPVPQNGLQSSEKTTPSSKEHVVRFSDEPEVLRESKSPIEKQMRKHELQAGIRILRSKNTTISNLISQLDLEWKEMCEERIELDVRLEKLKQQSHE